MFSMHKNVSQISVSSKSYEWRRFENHFHLVRFMEKVQVCFGNFPYIG